MKIVNAILCAPFVAVAFIVFAAVSGYLQAEDFVCRVFGLKRRWHEIPEHWRQFGYQPTTRHSPSGKPPTT